MNINSWWVINQLIYKKYTFKNIKNEEIRVVVLFIGIISVIKRTRDRHFNQIFLEYSMQPYKSFDKFFNEKNLSLNVYDDFF